jgi:hypothetical protein
MTAKQAIKWIEDEVRKNGVVEVQPHYKEHWSSKGFKKTMTGKLVGFSCSSQHIHEGCGSLVELVEKMKAAEKGRFKWESTQKDRG